MTIEQLAEASGVPAEKIAEIEKPDFVVEDLSSYTAAYIAEALGCMVSDLIYEDRK